MIDIEKERERTGYKGKPQQWQYGFDIAMSIAQKAEAEKCVWRRNTSEYWGSGCEHAHKMSNRFSLSANDFKYCLFCGKKIEEVSFEESE